MRTFKTTLSPIFGIFLIASFLAVVLPVGADTPEDRSWINSARVGGIGFVETMADHEIDSKIDRLISEGVNVIEGDASMSDLLTEQEFAIEKAFIKRVVDRAHTRGLPIVWYYPAMEIITIKGKYRDIAISKTHMDWVQLGFDRKSRNVFVGSKVFWVGPEDESAWVCPNTPYRDFFYSRVRELAETGLDGIWLDVPLYFDVVAPYNCTCRYCREKFEKQTGMTFPTQSSYEDPSFRRFIVWRHQTISEFLHGALLVAREVNPKIRIIVETLPCDTHNNAMFGLDGAFLHPDMDIVWEVDTLSETNNMYNATWKDWAGLGVTYKYTSNIARGRGSWVFVYGWRNTDAQLNMALALAAQNNPYETRSPEMVRTVGHRYRTKMYRWIENYTDAIYKSSSSAKVLIYYSSKTRDYLDGFPPNPLAPQGLATTPPAPIQHWVCSVWDYQYIYKSEYTGWGMLLMDGQVPFDIVGDHEAQTADFSRYHVVIVPQAEYLSTAEHKMLVDFVRSGGVLIVTGKKAGAYDELGYKHKTSLWSELVNNSDSLIQEVKLGKGRIFFWRERPGRLFHDYEDRDKRDRALELLVSAGVTRLMEGDARIVVQSYEDREHGYYHLVNLSSVGRKPKPPTKQDVPLSIPWALDRPVEGVWITSPEHPERQTLTYVKKEGRLKFIAPVFLNALIIVKG